MARVDSASGWMPTATANFRARNFPGQKISSTSLTKTKTDSSPNPKWKPCAAHECNRAARPGQGGGAAQELFRGLDSNADQKISAKEWATLLQAADFKKADTQADGLVTPEEWMRYFGQDQRPAGVGAGGAQVGALVPKVSAQFMKGDRVLDFSKIKRHTVVVFGSYT